MSLHVVTTHEKISEVERLIREAKDRGERPEVLSAVAADLRARLAGQPTVTLVEIERRVVTVARTKSRTGYSPHALHGLGEGVVAHWPTIKQALERFAVREDAR